MCSNSEFQSTGYGETLRSGKDLSRCHLLKVKCNEIWTIFLFSKNIHKKVSYTNRKQNQLLKISFVRTIAPKTRKSDDFRELHENEPEMAALGVETKLQVL